MFNNETVGIEVTKLIIIFDVICYAVAFDEVSPFNRELETIFQANSPLSFASPGHG